MSKPAPSTPAPEHFEGTMDFERGVEFIPVFIFSLLMMSSFINQDTKGIFWLIFTILGLTIASNVINYMNPQGVDQRWRNYTMLPLFAIYYKSCSLSSFLIAFSFTYLWMPMIYVNNINYAVVAIFIFFFIYDILGRRYILYKGDPKIPNYDGIGTFTGTFTGITYGILCFYLIYSIGGDSMLYFSTTSSNKEYCSRPKKQQFKCNVYKNGQVISTL
jgi:hypothetical protein